MGTGVCISVRVRSCFARDSNLFPPCGATSLSAGYHNSFLETGRGLTCGHTSAYFSYPSHQGIVQRGCFGEAN
jgi:hypothetical protein